MILGEGLDLRLPVHADRPRWLELLQDADQLRLGSPAFVAIPSSVKDLDEKIEEAAEGYAATRPGLFAVVLSEMPDHLLGIISWRWDVPTPLQVSDIGYSVHPDARCQGVARRATRTFTRWLTADEDGPRMARVQLDHSVENPASCKVALSAGFAREGVRRAFLPLRDGAVSGGVRRHDVCLHGFVPGAWT